MGRDRDYELDESLERALSDEGAGSSPESPDDIEKSIRELENHDRHFGEVLWSDFSTVDVNRDPTNSDFAIIKVDVARVRENFPPLVAGFRPDGGG